MGNQQKEQASFPVQNTPMQQVQSFPFSLSRMFTEYFLRSDHGENFPIKSGCLDLAWKMPLRLCMNAYEVIETLKESNLWPTLVKEEKQQVIKHVLRIYKEKSGELEEIIKEE